MSRTKQAAVVTALVFTSASAEGNAIAKKPGCAQDPLDCSARARVILYYYNNILLFFW